MKKELIDVILRLFVFMLIGLLFINLEDTLLINPFNKIIVIILSIGCGMWVVYPFYEREWRD